MSAPTRSLEQQRASHALAKVSSLKDYGRYLQEVEALPAAIRTNGLGQSIATLAANAKENGDKAKGCKHLMAHLEEWLCTKCPLRTYQTRPLIRAIVEGDEAAFLKAQAEALAYLVWLKKFARANLEPGKGD